MPKLLILSMLVATASCSFRYQYWEAVDQVVKDIQTLQDNLVQSIEEVNDQQKRSFSIIVTGILRYLQTNTQLRSVKGDVLDQPIDVYASETTRSLAREQMLLEMPMYAAKKVCRPPIPRHPPNCVMMYEAEISKLRTKCHGIDNHSKLFLKAVKLHTDDDYRNLLSYILQKSQETDDEDAYKVVIDILTDDKYDDIRDKLKEYYQLYARNNYECIAAHYK